MANVRKRSHLIFYKHTSPSGKVSLTTGGLLDNRVSVDTVMTINRQQSYSPLLMRNILYVMSYVKRASDPDTKKENNFLKIYLFKTNLVNISATAD